VCWSLCVAVCVAVRLLQCVLQRSVLLRFRCDVLLLVVDCMCWSVCVAVCVAVYVLCVY